MKAVMYGAGNIGRGFIGQLLYESGYETSFVDVNKAVIEAMNTTHEYPVRILYKDTYDEIMVKNVCCVDGNDLDAVAQAIAEADLMATAVGVNIIKFIVKPVANGLRTRWQQGNKKPLNIIICENLIGADSYMKGLIAEQLNDDEKKLLDELVGFVEASIGRMVPVQTPEMQDGNPLRVCVESFGILPVDKDAFKGEIPYLKNMVPFAPFDFYIKRKLYIHNFGHAMTAYLGDMLGCEYIWQAIENPYVELLVLRAMQRSAMALSAQYGVPYPELNEHVEDLIHRFANRQLGDTVKRVGNDLNRKLSPNDRMVGSLRACIDAGIPTDYGCLAIAAAMNFSHDAVSEQAPEDILKNIAQLDMDSEQVKKILELYELVKAKTAPEKLNELLKG